MFGRKPSLIISLMLVVSLAQADFDPILQARLRYLEKKIAIQHERLQNLRSLTYKYHQELKLIQTDHQKPKVVRVKHNLNSLADLAEKRFVPNNNIFKFSSPDEQFNLTFHSLLEVDNDVFLNYNGLTLNNGIFSYPIINQNTATRIWVNRARPVIEGSLFRYLNFFINSDFGQSQQRLYDGFISLHYWRSLGIKIGKQTSLVSGVENYVMASVYHTLQPGFTTIMAPNREIGAVVFGALGPYRPRPYNIWLSPFGFDDWLSYQLGFLGGTADGTNPGLNPINFFEFNTQNSSISNKAFEGRVLFNPFMTMEQSLLEPLALGFAGSSQIVNAESPLPAMVSPGLNPIFVYQSTVFANGPRHRIHPTIFWHYKKFGMLLDATQTIQHLADGNSGSIKTAVSTVGQTNRALQLQFTYNLTQEPYQYLNLRPEHDFHFFEKGGTGAWQVVFQYSGLWMDPSIFKDFNIQDQQKTYLYSDPRISVQTAKTFTFALHWYWNPSFRLSTEFDQTSYLGGCSTGGLNSPVSPGCLTAPRAYITAVSSEKLDRPTERLIMERIQLYF